MSLKDKGCQKPAAQRLLVIVVAFLISALCLSCGPSRPIGKEQAIVAAKHEAQGKGWTVWELEPDAFFTNGHWEVSLWAIPPLPIRTGEEGVMRVDFNVATKGQVSPYRAVEPSGPPITKEQAMAAAKQWAGKLGVKEIKINSVSFSDDHWEVGFWAFNRPGGFIGLNIATNGRVTAFHPSE